MNTLGRALIALGAAILLTACGSGSGTQASTDAFVTEYESLNGQETPRGGEYSTVEIPDDHRFVPASEAEIRELLTDGDGAIYFGFPECPWCRNAVPVMNQAAQDVGLAEIHYLNVADIRDVKTLDDDGEIVVEEPGSEFYAYLLERLGDFAPEYDGLEDPSVRRIYVPLVAVVVGGEVVASHLGTVDSQEDPSIPLTPEQTTELTGIYTAMFSEIPGCSSESKYCE